MDNVGYVSYSLAAMKARALDVTANNIANADTAGFRASRTSFESLVVDTGTRDAMAPMSYAIDKGTFNDLREGAVHPTGNPFDLALSGNGLFAYERSDGRIGMGRDGGFTLSTEGELVTASGHRLLDIGGAPIAIDPDAGAVTIAADGTISTPAGVVARVGTFEEPDAEHWMKASDGMLVPRTGEPAMVPAIGTTLRQGFVEASNVDPIREMTAMIEISRSYERAMGVAEGADELRSQTIQRLGRPA